MTGATLIGAVLVAIGVLHLVYTYAAYPWLVSRLPRRSPGPGSAGAPALVSIVIAARVDQEQAGGLLQKVRDLLATVQLPCEVVVAVDGGSAPGVAEGLQAMDVSRVRAVSVPAGSGKAGALNRGVEASRGEVLVFTDVRQRIEPGAVEELVRTLQSPDVGAVAGSLVLAAGRRDGLYERYWRFERDLRVREAAWDSAVGVSGALYALKRGLWEPLPAGLILDDLWVPFQAIKAGLRVAFAEGAIATDRGAGSDAGELARKVRTLTGNYQLLAWMPWLLNPLRNRIWWQFVSHKVLRLFTPLALASLVVGTALLLPLAASLAIAALLVLGLLARPRGRNAAAPGVGITGGLRSAGVLVVALVVAALNAMRGRWDVWNAGAGSGSS